MIDREEIISKQYKHYKELYLSKETLQKELEGVIAELTEQIEKEKKAKQLRESIRDTGGLMDAYAMQQQLDGNYDQSGIIEESASLSDDYDSQENDEDEFALNDLDIVKVQTMKHIMMRPVMVDYKKRAFKEARRNSLDLVSLVKPDLIAQAG